LGRVAEGHSIALGRTKQLSVVGLAAAADYRLNRGVRVIAITSLGRMKVMPAVDLSEKLLADPAVSANNTEVNHLARS